MRAIFLAAFAVCGGLCAQPVQLSADAFLKKIIDGGIADQIQNARFYFSPGKSASVPYSMQKLMIHLAARGVQTEGKMVPNRQLYMDTVADLSKENLTYEITNLEKPSLPSFSAFLGVPNGVSPFKEINPAKPYSKFEEEVKPIFARTMAIHEDCV